LQIKFLILLLFTFSLEAKKPDLFLLNKYSTDINITSWYMSEKLDGFRAFWDGEKLISRSGKVFTAPSFFTKEFPKIQLDGELWTKRNDFANISSIINTKSSNSQWSELTYNIFEVPHAEGNLTQRLSSIKESSYLKIVKQIKIKNSKYLDIFLKSIENELGEGVVIRDASLNYYTGRKNKALKVKSYIDEECIVIGYNQGQGKYENILGSIECTMDNNKTIKIGTGFTKIQRKNPPKIGTKITFKYYGLTSKGNPRFPVFLKIRQVDETISTINIRN